MSCKNLFPAGLFIAALLFLFPPRSSAALCFCFKSASAKNNFTLLLELPTDDWKRGTVQYKGSKEKIPIIYAGSEELEWYDGRPSYMKYTWQEMYNGRITGTYVLFIQGAMVYEGWYIRRKDRKKFSLKRVQDIEECTECFTAEEEQ